MMKVTLRFSILFVGLLMLSGLAWAQPANDNCANAAEVVVSASEATVVTTEGDTRNATFSAAPTDFCFADTHLDDDIWFQFTLPAVLADHGYVVRAYFNSGVTASDVAAVGMALYEGCGAGETATHCFTDPAGVIRQFNFSTSCAVPGQTYYLRVWAEGTTAATRGTFRIGVYAADPPTANVLWSETFAGGIEANGWVTAGTCANPDSNINGGFVYLPDGIIDAGAYAFPGYRVSGESWCDGAVGFDSDYNDNFGIAGNFGAGPCPAPSIQMITSPVIATDMWNVPGITLTWTQAIRTFTNSTYIVSYRTNTGGVWGAWVEEPVNEEFVVNARYRGFNVQRVPLVGAAGADSLQFRFTYNANYYFWAIDDVMLIEQEANNMRVQTNFFATSPWWAVPENQVYPFPVLADIYNAGALTQHNVILNHKEVDDQGNVLYDVDLPYGDLTPDTLAENKLFPELVDLPQTMATYTGTYTVRADEVDFDPSDNVIEFEHMVGGDDFRLENGATRSLAPAASNYDPGAPHSYAYGNNFYVVTDAPVAHLHWGVSNPDDMAGRTVNLLLLQWTDNNGDEVAQFDERRFVGYAEYTFTGTEGDNAELNTVLENLEGPGQIMLQGGFRYMAVVEWQAEAEADPTLFLLASEARDYSASNLAFDQAFDAGLTDMRFYASVLGLPPDGNLGQIDYNVSTGTFGFDIVPVMRIVTGLVNTKDELPLDNLISVYPNPASDKVQVKLEFEKAYEDVRLRLINPIGQTVYIKDINATITEYTESIDVKNLTSGNYLLQVETPDGQRSVPVVVTK